MAMTAFSREPADVLKQVQTPKCEIVLTAAVRK